MRYGLGLAISDDRSGTLAANMIGVAAGLAGISLIRLSKSMEDWEMSLDEEKEEKE